MECYIIGICSYDDISISIRQFSLVFIFSVPERLGERKTELSKHVWMLKDSNKSYKVVWCIVARAPPYKSGSGRCALCLTEKSVIVRANPKGLLNKRTELISKCRHRNKYLLCNIPSPQRSIK